MEEKDMRPLQDEELDIVIGGVSVLAALQAYEQSQNPASAPQSEKRG